MSKPWIVSSVSGWTCPKPSSSLPAERSDANGTISSAGKPRSLSLASMTVPDGAGGAHDGDAVLAHTTGSFPNGCSALMSSVAELERRVQRAHGVVELVGADDAGDLDRRRGDHLDVDAALAERGEDLGGDARVRAHAGADDGHLAHLGVLGERLDAELADDRVQRLVRGAQVGARAR